MYLFINETSIEPYNGEILKRYINDRLIKIIANPTDNDLCEFGYKKLDDSEERLEEKEGFYIKEFYSNENVIKKHYKYVAIPPEELEGLDE